MGVLDSLRQARANYAALLAEVSSNPKPTYSAEGRAFSWTEYQQFLLESLERLRQQIAAEEAADNGPVEEVLYGVL